MWPLNIQAAKQIAGDSLGVNGIAVTFFFAGNGTVSLVIFMKLLAAI